MQNNRFNPVSTRTSISAARAFPRLTSRTYTLQPCIVRLCCPSSHHYCDSAPKLPPRIVVRAAPSVHPATCASMRGHQQSPMLICYYDRSPHRRSIADFPVLPSPDPGTSPRSPRNVLADPRLQRTHKFCSALLL